jgi:hypothetical protein
MIDPELEDLVNDLNSIERLEMAAKLERWGFELLLCELLEDVLCTKLSALCFLIVPVKPNLAGTQ